MGRAVTIVLRWGSIPIQASDTADPAVTSRKILRFVSGPTLRQDIPSGTIAKRHSYGSSQVARGKIIR